MGRSPLLPILTVPGQPRLIRWPHIGSCWPCHPLPHPASPAHHHTRRHHLTCHHVHVGLGIHNHDPGVMTQPGNVLPPSPRRGGATSAYRAGADFLEVKHHRLWASDVFWVYIRHSIGLTPFVTPPVTYLYTLVKFGGQLILLPS